MARISDINISAIELQNILIIEYIGATKAPSANLRLSAAEY